MLANVSDVWLLFNSSFDYQSPALEIQSTEHSEISPAVSVNRCNFHKNAHFSILFFAMALN